MVQLEVRTLSAKGTLSMEDKPLGRGGEGSVYNVISHTVSGLPPAADLVVKIYHKPREGNRREKVISMVSAPPDSDMFAWPLGLLARNGEFVGFIMDKLKANEMKEWAHLAHTQTRRSIAPSFDVRYAIAACLNLAIATEAAHSAGHRLGDILNESNAAVGADASIILLDTDSAQIRGKDGRIFRCEVGKPEYTAAELIGRPLRDQDRTKATDAFAFGILVFQMLTGGAHPTDGIYGGQDDPPSTTSKISQGILPMLRDESIRGFKPVPRIAVVGIPSRIKRLIAQLSDSEAQRRPSFEHSIAVLQDVQSELKQCPKDSAHWFDGRDGSCGWCRHADSGQLDPWGKPRQTNVQSKLPPVNFNTQSAPSGKAPRAPIRPPQHSSGYAPTPTQQRFQPSAPSTPAPQSPPGAGLSPLAQQLLAQANGTAQPAQQVQQAVQQQNQIPPKVKGKMTVVYSDGSYGPRPPLGSLFTHNNRLWREAIAVEWPDLLKLWWPADRPVPRALALWLSPLVAIGSLLGISWGLEPFLIADPRLLQIGVPLLAIGSLFSALASLIWWINSWVGRSRAKRDYGSLANVRHENFAKTLGRSLAISLGYLLTPVVGAVAILIMMLKVVIRGDRQNSLRRW